MGAVPKGRQVLIAVVDVAGNRAFGLATYGTAAGDRYVNLSEGAHRNGAPHWRPYAWDELPTLPEVQ